MNRCLSLARRHGRALAVPLAIPLTFGLSAAALAQSASVRDFPPDALRGTLVVLQAPKISMDGRAAELSPGARIRSPQNIVLLPSHLANQTLTVNYTREMLGLVHDVWILTPEEAALKRPRLADLKN